MTKFSYFLTVKTNYLGDNYIKLFIQEIVRLHGAQCRLILTEACIFFLILGGFFRKGWVLRLTLVRLYGA